MVALMIHKIFLLACCWPKHITCLNLPQLKLWNIQMILPNFQNCACCEKYLNDNKGNNLHLMPEYSQVFLSLDIICSEKQTVF